MYSILAPPPVLPDTRPLMGDYPGRKQVRKRAKRAVKNDRIIAKKAAAATKK